jgi:hypothetical protein
MKSREPEHRPGSPPPHNEFAASADRMPLFLARFQVDRGSLERLFTVPWWTRGGDESLLFQCSRRRVAPDYGAVRDDDLPATDGTRPGCKPVR